MGQLGFLMDVQGVIVRGVGNMANTVENELTENEERNDKQEPAPTTSTLTYRK